MNKSEITNQEMIVVPRGTGYAFPTIQFQVCNTHKENESLIPVDLPGIRILRETGIHETRMSLSVWINQLNIMQESDKKFAAPAIHQRMA